MTMAHVACSREKLLESHRWNQPHWKYCKKSVWFHFIIEILRQIILSNPWTHFYLSVLSFLIITSSCEVQYLFVEISVFVWQFLMARIIVCCFHCRDRFLSQCSVSIQEDEYSTTKIKRIGYMRSPNLVVTKIFRR